MTNNNSSRLGSYKPSFLASQMRESSSFELGVSRLKRTENVESKVTGSLISNTTQESPAQSSPVIVAGALLVGNAAKVTESSSVTQQIASEGGEQDKTGSWSTSSVAVSDLLF